MNHPGIRSAHSSYLMVALFIFLFALTGTLSAQTPAPAAASGCWEGALMESGNRLLFTLTFDGVKAKVHISGPGYWYTITGTPLRMDNSPLNTYSVVTSAKKVDVLRGGKMELSRPQGLDPNQFLLVTYKSNGKEMHKLVLTSRR